MLEQLTRRARCSPLLSAHGRIQHLHTLLEWGTLNTGEGAFAEYCSTGQDTDLPVAVTTHQTLVQHGLQLRRFHDGAAASSSYPAAALLGFRAGAAGAAGAEAGASFTGAST